MRTIRRATAADIETIMRLIDSGRHIMRLMAICISGKKDIPNRKPSYRMSLMATHIWSWTRRSQ